MTLKELSEHPERASEEDKKAFEDALNAIREFKEQSKYVSNGIRIWHKLCYSTYRHNG